MVGWAITWRKQVHRTRKPRRPFRSSKPRSRPCCLGTDSWRRRSRTGKAPGEQSPSWCRGPELADRDPTGWLLRFRGSCQPACATSDQKVWRRRGPSPEPFLPDPVRYSVRESIIETALRRARTAASAAGRGSRAAIPRQRGCARRADALRGTGRSWCQPRWRCVWSTSTKLCSTERYHDRWRCFWWSPAHAFGWRSRRPKSTQPPADGRQEAADFAGTKRWPGSKLLGQTRCQVLHLRRTYW